MQSQPQQLVFSRALAHLRGGDANRAASVCLEGLEQYPNDANILCLAGKSLLVLKRFPEARIQIEKASTLYPKFPVAHETLADLLLAEGQFEEAVKSYQLALQLDPARSDLHAKIARANELIKSMIAAGGSRQTMAFADEMAQAAEFERGGEPQKSEPVYRDILRRDPDHVEAMVQLAAIATTHKKYRDAELLLQRAVSQASDYARAWRDLSAAQAKQEKHQPAIQSAEQVVKLMPKIAEPLISLATVQASAGLTEKAIDSYRNALVLAPKHPGAFAGLGHQLKTVGRQQEAIEVHRQNIAANPKNSEPFWSLANMKTFRFDAGEVEAMERLLEDQDIKDLAIAQLSNSLGLEYESRKEYDRAFKYFQHCNKAQRKSENYDPVGNEVTIGKIIELFDQQFLEKNAGFGVADSAPILIVGLPRSGSTLIEQILASHSQVEGTHELSDLDSVVRSLPKINAQLSGFPDTLMGLKQKAWAKIGNQYLHSTEKYRSDLPHFIDKNPNNFIYAGLLQLALPNAKIINARRHPLDSCFGSYKQLFASGQPFTYDLTEIGEYYFQYQTLMDHWHQLMPGKILDVHYEEVVADLDNQVRRILDYCELPFEEACVRFHETDRAVKTASSEQVRQPIYSSSVNLWQHYESHLAELIEILEPLLIERPVEERPLSLK